MNECAGGRSGVKRGREREREREALVALKMKVARSLARSHRSKSMAFAQGLILLGVESLPLQVDLAEL